MTTSAPPLLRRVVHLMGMPVSLAVRPGELSVEAVEVAWGRVIDELTWVDRTFSTYRSDSAISKLGRGEVSVEDCPPEVKEVLDLGEHARIVSRGAFDVHRPGPDGTVQLDPAGVVKGWAVERAALHLEECGVPAYCLSAGGDMVCRTRNPEDPEWLIGIEDPHDPRGVVAKVPVRNGGVATSGLAHRGAHLTDARTGATPEALASVTVVDESLTWADIDATAAFTLGVDGPGWLRERGRTAVIVWADGNAEVLAPDRPEARP